MVKRLLRILLIVVAGWLVLAGVVFGSAALHIPLPFGLSVNFPGMLPSSVREPVSEQDLATRIHLPADFSLNTYVPNLPNARALRFTANGDLLVSTPRTGKIWLVEADKNHDGYADGVRTLLEDLKQPHGIALLDDWLYVAETDAVLRVRYDQHTRALSASPERIITGLPGGGNHWTRTIAFGPDGWLYLSIGSDCNVCIEEDPRRAAISRYHPDGTGGEVYATGLRNSVGLAWQPGTGALYATDNGRDLLGDDFPPCELNHIVAGGFYGWPYANGNKVPDPKFGGDSARVAQSIAPAFSFRAHNAPLGITFYTGTAFPERYRDAAFVALHGSWNRSQKDGYKVVALFFAPDGSIRAEDFITGFEKDEEVIGRPVDVAVGPDGALYVSDDYAGSLYRIAYRDPARGKGAAVAAHEKPQTVASGAEAQAAATRGEALWNKFACAECHLKAENRDRRVPELEQLKARYDVDSLSAFLLAPQPPMPQFPMSDEQRRDLSQYLLQRFP